MIRAADGSATLFIQMNGRLSEHPLAELIREASATGLSGALRLERGRVKAVVYAREGEIVYARSNLRGHRLVECARRSGMVAEEVLSQVVTEMMSDAEASAALAASGALNDGGHSRLRALQVQDVLRTVLVWTDGEWDFDPRARLAEDVAVRFDLRQLLLEGARHLPPEFAASRLANQSEIISPAADTPVHLELLPTEAFVLTRADAPARLDQLAALCAMPETQTLHAIYALTLCGFLARTAWPGAIATAEAQARAAVQSPQTAKAGANDGAPAKSESEAEPDPRAEVEALLALVRAGNYYEVLGVGRDAGSPDVKRAYYTLAKRFHPDRFRRTVDDEETRVRIEKAFAEIARAYETLHDPRARESYENKLAAQASMPAPANAQTPAATPPTPPDAAGAGRTPRAPDNANATSQHSAEESFQTGLAALGRGDAAAACVAFGEAVRLAPQQARYHALFGRALTASAHTRRQAEAELHTAIKLDSQNASYHVALAELYTAIGLQRRAEGELKRALSLDPNHDAARQMLQRMKGK